MANKKSTQGTFSLQKLVLVLLAAALAFVAESLGLTDLLGDSAPVGTLTADTSVHFLNVGQGDAALFISGEQSVLIDASTGGASDTILSYLEEQNIDQLDVVIATHPHADHIGGMRKVLQKVPAETIYMSNGTTNTKTFTNLLAEIDKQGMETIVPEIGDVLTLDSGATFTFLAPDPAEEFDNLNNYSLVCMFEAGDTRILMTGDAEVEIEEAILASGADIDCDILKLGHHGSSTSSSRAFLEAASPETAIISCAEVNDYGHPHRETLESLDALKIDDVRYTYEGHIAFSIPKDGVA